MDKPEEQHSTELVLKEASVSGKGDSPLIKVLEPNEKHLGLSKFEVVLRPKTTATHTPRKIYKT